MKLSLRRSEIQAFKALCLKENEGVSIVGLASSLGKSKSFTSRIVGSLVEKGFVELTRQGKKKTVKISPAQHAVMLKELLASNPHILFEDILQGAAVQVLTGLLYSSASVEAISTTTFSPEVTVRVVLMRMLDRGGVARQKPGVYSIVLPRLRDFIESYIRFAVEAKRTGVQGSLIICGASGLIRTSEAEIPAFMVSTGLNAFGKFGVKLIQTDFKDYYFNILKPVKKPSFEEVLVHSLVRAKLVSSSRELSYVLLVIAKNRKTLNQARFFNVARQYSVESSAKQCIEFVDAVLAGKEIPKPLVVIGEGTAFPDETEFTELLKQYE